MNEKDCGFTWYTDIREVAVVKDQFHLVAGSFHKCVRRKGHEGNHFSYPSREEHFNDNPLDSDDDVHKPASEHAEHNHKS